LLLILFGLAEGSSVLWLAALAITGGALLASKDMVLSRKKGAPVGSAEAGV
jgi:hypothetical protein